MAERRVALHDVGIRDALGVQEGAQDLVGGPGIDVVGSEQHPPLCAAAVLAHQVLDGGDGLLVWRRTGVEHVAGGFLALVLNRIKQ